MNTRNYALGLVLFCLIFLPCAVSAQTEESELVTFDVKPIARMPRGGLVETSDGKRILIWGYFPKPEEIGKETRIQVESLDRTVIIKGNSDPSGSGVAVYKIPGLSVERMPTLQPESPPKPIVDPFAAPKGSSIDMPTGKGAVLVELREFIKRDGKLLLTVVWNADRGVKPNGIAIVRGGINPEYIHATYKHGGYSSMSAFDKEGKCFGQVSLLGSGSKSQGNVLVAIGEFSDSSDNPEKIPIVLTSDSKAVSPVYWIPTTPLQVEDHPIPVTESQMRNWKDVSGSQIRARLVQIYTDSISLQPEAGEMINWKIDSLSPPDIEYVKRARKGSSGF